MIKLVKKIDELEEIKVLIKAGYPIIYIVSTEEQRILNMLNDLLPSVLKDNIAEIKPHIWSTVKGFKKLGEIEAVEDTRDPFDALKYIDDSKIPTLFVLCDYHHFLTDQNYDVVRYLRELAVKLKKERKFIIILSPVLRIPSELEKEITVIDFPLPSNAEIKKVINSIKARAKESVNKDQFNFKQNGEHLIKTLMGLTTVEIENVLFKSLAKARSFSIDVIIREKEQIIRKGGILEFYNTEEKASDIGGLDILKTWISQRRKAFTNKARQFGIPIPKGILFVGIPGCGKSLTCKVIANMWKYPLIRLDVGKIFSGIVGSSEDNIRKAIKLAESIAPCILWIDEIEKAFSGVQSSNFSDSGTTARVFGSFLTWMQEKKKSVFVVATANDINSLPQELLRKGRFDELFFIDLPNSIEREEIFRIHIEKRKRNAKDYDLKNLTQKSEGFSGAEIEASIISALYDAFDENEELSTKYILANLKKIVPLSTTMKEKIDTLRKWAVHRARKGSSEVSKTKEQEQREVIL